jgi:hypothetical protein
VRHGYTDKELEELLGEGGTSDEDASVPEPQV